MAARGGSLSPLSRQATDLARGRQRDHAGLVGHVVGHLHGVENREVLGVHDLGSSLPTELLDGLSQFGEHQCALALFGVQEPRVASDRRLEFGLLLL